ncbi:hypothetical protein CGRA01v4_01819 [Colletotrichum graminicola]|nr:hypothetical protein CGRA01v4_01819 [Colletotrichum graminicola]
MLQNPPGFPSLPTSLIVLLFTWQTFVQLQPRPFCLIPSCFYFLGSESNSFFATSLLLLSLSAAARSTFACRCFSPSRL